MISDPAENERTVTRLMARLIDPNDVYSLFDRSGFARMHLSDIDTIPRVDAVEVVRCRSCKDYNWIPNCGRPVCTNIRGLAIAKPNDFCSYGERKEGAD